MRLLVPYVNEKRTTPDQHALLICDTHVSSINEEALQTLKHTNIDMIISPAHSTSKYQPLDVGIYLSYKDNFRRYYRGKGGLYNLLFASINAFQYSLLPTKIQGAWEASHILDENINEYLNILKVLEVEESNTLTDYANRICVSRYDYSIRNTRSIVL